MNTYAVSGSHIVHKNIVGEVIIVDLQQGYYFSLTESAPHIWSALVAGLDRGATVQRLSAQFAASPEQIENAVDSVISELVENNLIVTAISDELNFAPPAVTGEPLPFKPPVVQKYTDMEDVLLLDPIDDFDDAGWPMMSAPAYKS